VYLTKGPLITPSYFWFFCISASFTFWDSLYPATSYRIKLFLGLNSIQKEGGGEIAITDNASDVQPTTARFLAC
jgi:hypothetical protein